MHYLNITLDDAHLQRTLVRAGRLAPYALAIALTRTARSVRGALNREIRRSFDRPTRYTLRSFWVVSANARKLQSSVEFGPYPNWWTAHHYMEPQVSGGQRRDKASETWLRARGLIHSSQQWVPGADMRLDDHGNVPGGQITRILSGLGALPDPLQNQTDRSRRRQGRRAANLLILREMGATKPLGVYDQRPDGELLELLKYVPRPQYSPRLDYDAVVRRTALREFLPHLEHAITRVLTKTGPAASTRADWRPPSDDHSYGSVTV